MRIYLILLAALLFGSTLVLAQEPPQSATASPSIYDEAYLSLWAKRLAFMQAASTRIGRSGGKYTPATTPAGKRIRSSGEPGFHRQGSHPPLPAPKMTPECCRLKTGAD